MMMQKTQNAGNAGGTLRAGAAEVDISPDDSQFLWGYPHVERWSTGIHDPLYASSLYLEYGGEKLLFIANDIIFITKDITVKVRTSITARTGIPGERIMVTATHTHSGPSVVEYASNRFDTIVPKPDEIYLDRLVRGIVESGCCAVERAEPAEIGFSTVDGVGIGTNRRDPQGPADPAVPVTSVRAVYSGNYLAIMAVYSMHPTVLHEDSTLVSADFPGAVRGRIKNALGEDVPVVYHTGPSGNQSPRHSVRANTFAEAERLGTILGDRILSSLDGISYTAAVPLAACSAFVELPRKKFPCVAAAKADMEQASAKFRRLKAEQAPVVETRTAECDWFGAEERYALSVAAAEGSLDATYKACMPAEIQVFSVGGKVFAAWPGELFVEYGLELKRRTGCAGVISLANGELQGYIVTAEAAAEGGYEVGNALFAPESGRLLVERTALLIDGIHKMGIA